MPEDGGGSSPASSRRLLFTDGPVQGTGRLTGAASVDAALRILMLMTIQCVFSFLLTAQAKSPL